MRVLPAGPRAVLLEVADTDAAHALYAELRRRIDTGELPPVADVVPAARTVLLDGLPDPAAVAGQVQGWTVPPAPPPAGEVVEIPTVYDGEDIDEVARRGDLSTREVVEAHTADVLTVAFCGFMPGFGYCTGLPERLVGPRRDSPRPKVPAGSVGLAGPFTAVYPGESPGGWQLIGRTDVVLWDVDRNPPAVLAPGVRVRFVEAGR